MVDDGQRRALTGEEPREDREAVRAANPEALEKPPPAPSGEVVSLDGRYKFLRIMFWLYAVGAFLGAVNAFRTVRFLQDAMAGRFSSQTELTTVANAIDQSEMIRVIVTFVIFIVCTVAYGRFVMRASKNLSAVGSSEITMSPGSLVWWYFVPFANLVMPLQGVSEVARGSREAAGQSKTTPATVGLWWGAWIFGTIASGIAGGLSRASGIDRGFNVDMDMYLTALWTGVASGVLFGLSAIFFTAAARRIRDDQSRLMGKGVVEAFD